MKKIILFASLAVFVVMFSCSESLPTGVMGSNEDEKVEKTDEAQVSESSEVEKVKFAMDYEPVISRVEDAIAVINAKLMMGEDVTDSDKAELDKAINEIDKFADVCLSSDYQFRYNVIVERLSYLIEVGAVDY